MRIFTYPDPFELKSNTELWDIITKHPHFCASDTLLQGLGTEYKRIKQTHRLLQRMVAETAYYPKKRSI